MDEPQSNHKTTTRKFFQFDKLALVLGFVVDSITLTSILLAISLPGGSFTLATFITPGLAFAIWLLMLYTYFAYLHYYWEKNLTEQNLADKFSLFLVNDLLFQFRKPLLLFPAIILIIALFWIAVSADKSYGLVLNNHDIVGNLSHTFS